MKKEMNVEYNSKKRKTRGAGSLIRKMLQLLGIQRAFVRSLSTSEEEGIRTDVHPYYNSKEIRAALFEAERKKAEGLMEWQKRRFIC